MKKEKNTLASIKIAADYFRDEMAKYRQAVKEEDCLILPSQAAAMMGISPQAVECRMKEGSLKTFTVFGRYWVSGREVEGIMKERINERLTKGEDKNEMEEKMFMKMAANAKVMSRRSRASKAKKK